MTSAPQIFKRRNKVWLPPRQNWGPNGRRAPWGTPVYETAADHVVADLAALQTLLLGVTVNSGEVIEVTNLALDGSAFSVTPLRGGNAAWANNVLVRPPLGSRSVLTGAGDAMKVQTQNVTFGGMDGGGFTTQAGVDTPSRTGFYRCTLNRLIGSGRFSLNVGSIDCFLSECVSPYSFHSQDLDGNDKDCIQVTCPTRPLLDGCYVAPRHLGVFPSLMSIDTTDVSTRDISAVMSGLSTPFIVQYVRVSVPGSTAPITPNSVTVTLKKNGVAFLTLTAPSLANSNNGSATSSPFSDFAYGKNPGGGGYATLDNGDTLTASITGHTGNPPRLLINVGQPSTAHLDSFQNFATSGTIDDQTVKNSVIIGSENSAMQIQNVKGLWRCSHNYMCRDENYAVNFDGSRTDIVCILDSNTFNGKFVFRDPVGAEHHVEGNHFTNVQWDNPFSLPASNFVDALMYPMPPDLGDLVAAWPGCPYTPANPYGNKWI